MRSPYARARQREPQQENDEKRTIIEREYPQDAPNIEIAKIAGRRFRIEKDSGDEEARKREKHVYAAPPEPEETQDRAREPKNAQADAEMVDDDQQDRDATNTVQGRNMQAGIRPAFRLCAALPRLSSHTSPPAIGPGGVTRSHSDTGGRPCRRWKSGQANVVCDVVLRRRLWTSSAPACWGAPMRPPLVGQHYATSGPGRSHQFGGMRRCATRFGPPITVPWQELAVRPGSAGGYRDGRVADVDHCRRRRSAAKCSRSMRSRRRASA